MLKEFKLNFKAKDVKVVRVQMKNGKMFYMNSTRLQDFIKINKKHIFTYRFIDVSEVQEKFENLQKRASGVFEYVK